ncbi:MAG: PDZ domain-containing protein [Nitrososphaeraceae archaeon]
MFTRSLFSFSVLLLCAFVVLAVMYVVYSDIQGTHLGYPNLLYATLLTTSPGANINISGITGTNGINLSETQDDDANGFERISNDSLPTFSSSLSRSDVSNQTEPGNTTRSTGSSSAGQFTSTSSAAQYPGTLQIPYTGLASHHVTPDIAKLFGLNETTYAILVTGVELGSPAEKAGIREGNMTTSVSGEIIKVGGDMILKVDGNTSFVRNSEAFLRYLEDDKRVGEEITLTVLRDGQVREIEMNIGATPRFLWYENKDEGIKIKYPSDWRLSESDLTKQDIVKFFSPETVNINNSSVSAAGFFVKILPSDISLDAIARAEQEDTENTRNLDMFLTEVSNLPAYERVFYDYSDTDRTLKLLSVFTIKDDQLFRINFAADPPNYNDYLPLAREMIKSFQFIK